MNWTLVWLWLHWIKLVFIVRQIFTRFLRSFNLPVGTSKLHVIRSGSCYDVVQMAWWIISMLVRLRCHVSMATTPHQSLPLLCVVLVVCISVVSRTRIIILQYSSVRGNAVFGRYYAVFQARTPFWKLRRVPWTQFYCGQYSRFEARFSHFQCYNPFCVYERFINSNLIADAQFQTPCAAVWHARCRHCHHTTGCNAHRPWCDSESGATKRVIHNIFIYMH